MKDHSNVSPLRNSDGTFVKGKSGNPTGVSTQQQAIKELQRQNEVILASNISALVAPAVKLHRALLKDGNMTIKDQLKLIELTYAYGIGKPRVIEAKKNEESEDLDLNDMPEEKRNAIIELLKSVGRDISE